MFFILKLVLTLASGDLIGFNRLGNNIAIQFVSKDSFQNFILSGGLEENLARNLMIQKAMNRELRNQAKRFKTRRRNYFAHFMKNTI